MTYRMSRHARDRCAEMGISTKVAKRIAREADLTYSGDPRHGDGAVVAMCSAVPEYAVVLDRESRVIVTVLFRTDEQYVRSGASYLAVVKEA